MSTPEPFLRLHSMSLSSSRDPEIAKVAKDSATRLRINSQLQRELEAITNELKRRDGPGGSVSGKRPASS